MYELELINATDVPKRLNIATTNMEVQPPLMVGDELFTEEANGSVSFCLGPKPRGTLILTIPSVVVVGGVEMGSVRYLEPDMDLAVLNTVISRGGTSGLSITNIRKNGNGIDFDINGIGVISSYIYVVDKSNDVQSETKNIRVVGAY